MVACIMGELKTVDLICREAQKRLNPDSFNQFINIKVAREMGGNNALLYACTSSKENNVRIVNYLIQVAGADANANNDHNIGCALIAAKKAQLPVLALLLQKGIDIGCVDKNGCNALHIATASGSYEMVEKLLMHWSLTNIKRRKKRR